MWLALALLATASSAPPNLLLVTIDTVRADHLHCYGHAGIETPVMDRLASEGVLVEEAVVQVPQTRPSHASILTGRYPYEHGVRDNFSAPMRSDLPTLATLLKAQGFDTAAFIGGFPVASASGLNRGFSVYDDRLNRSQADSGPVLAERRASEVVDSALGWLGKPRTRRFFAWVHLYDAHAPYEPPPPYDRQYAKQPYDGEIAYVDAQLGRLMAFLDDKGRARDTLVAVISDHGEALGEHGEDEHLMFVYDSTLRVPLLLSWPSVLPPGRRIAGQFRAVDLAPTLLDLMGVPAVPMSGVSRAANLKSGAPIPKNESYAESLYGQLHFGYAPLRSLRAEGWKYIEAPRPELFDLKQDPGETQSLIEQRAPLAAGMRKQLLGYDKGTETAHLDVPADAGAIERLVALGYVGAGGPSTQSGSGIDPKDKIAEHQSYTRDVQKALAFYRAGDVDAALPILTRLSRQDSVSFEVQLFLGKCLLRSRRFEEAGKALEEARGLLPKFVGTYVDLAQALRMQGLLKEARVTVDRGLALAPRNAALWEEGGLVLQGMHDLPDAQAALEKARSLDPKSVRARLALSALYRSQGDTAAALAELREAVRQEPRFGDGWNALGVLLTAGGNDAEATRAFRSALDVRPDDLDALFNLADLHLHAGRPEQALPLLEKAASMAPNAAGLQEALEEARRRSEPLPAGCMELRLMRLADRVQAEAAAAKLAEGSDFGALARAESIDPSSPKGGQIGVVCIGDLDQSIRAAAAALAPGQLSPAIETASGFLLLKRER